MMKSAVDSAVVQQVRLCDGVSRVELARRLQIAPSTVGIHVDRLVRGGLIREGKRTAATSGRPPTMLELNPEAGQFIGVDLDAHQVRAISIDFAQRTLAQHVQPICPTATAADVVSLMGETIQKVRSRSHSMLGIGLAVPGTVDIERGVGLHYKYISGWRNLPLVKRMQDRFRVPVYIENNIRSMALAERWFGDGREANDYLCIGIRSGIGSGLIINGELYRGAGSVAGEIGSWPCVNPRTGQTETLEEVASIPTLLAAMTTFAKSGKPTSISLTRNQVSLDALLRAAGQGDRLACEVVGNAARALGRVIAQIHLLINPQRVIIAGPLAGLPVAFLAPLRETVFKLFPQYHHPKPVVIASKLDEFVAALGAAACAVHAWQPQSNVQT